MKKPKVCVLRTAGTNCDAETAYAFERAGASAQRLHINALSNGRAALNDFHILALPGGFSYGDDVAAGKILANELRCKLRPDIEKFIAAGKLIIGICNGFQILVKSGLLPGNSSWGQQASLVLNDSSKFESRWVYLRTSGAGARESVCVWTKGVQEVIYLPVAHGEGKFIAGETALLKQLTERGQVAVRYCRSDGSLPSYPDNPNGSQNDIAGICDKTGRIFGLMPHPERNIQFTHHPRWSSGSNPAGEPDGMAIFRNGVAYAQRNM